MAKLGEIRGVSSLLDTPRVDTSQPTSDIKLPTPITRRKEKPRLTDMHTRITFSYVPRDLAAKLDKYCKKAGLSKSQWFSDVLAQTMGE